MSKSEIYGKSYDENRPKKDVKEVLEALQDRQKAKWERTRELGRMLKEERARNQELQRRVNRLEEEKRKLANALARSHR